MRVKCLAQEHNKMTQPGLVPGLSDPQSSELTIRLSRLPQVTGNSAKTICIGRLFSVSVFLVMN